jgi:hypothetical protein
VTADERADESSDEGADESADGRPVVLEIRTYRLHDGTREEFHRVVAEEAVPLLAAFGISVLRYGPSEDDEQGVEEYVLIRAFPSLEVRTELEERFYQSREWHGGPRARILGPIVGYHTVVLTVTPSAVEGLRTSV